MKKITTTLVLAVSMAVYSQVGINTTTPHASASLELGSNNKAFYLNRVANISVIANPQPGMIIYDLSESCVKTYGGNPAGWSGCLAGSTDGNGTVASLTCGSVVFNPTTATHEAYTGTYSSLYRG
jgi:hypothetical protein